MPKVFFAVCCGALIKQISADMEMTMKIKLLVAFLVTILVFSIGGCKSKTTQTVPNMDLTNTANSPTTSGKTVDNPPQVIEPATENNDVMISLLSPLKIISITSPVLPGDTVTMVVQTAPNAYCWPSTSGTVGAMVTKPSSIPGAAPGIASSDANGRLTVTIKVDPDSLPGYCRVIVQVSNFNPVSPPTIASPQESTVLTSFLVY